jgi:AcrR family transcriptional regulator
MSPVRNSQQATQPDPDPDPDPAAGIRPHRPRRADARRNYESLLTAATAVFNEQGVHAPLDEIARRAGVGNATMYRHFPTRQELILAVYADEVSILCSHGAQRLSNNSPGDALFEWLQEFITHVASKRFLVSALTSKSGEQHRALFDRWHRAMHDTAAALLQRAQHAGVIRSDINAWDVLILANGVALAATETSQAHRLLTTIRHGLNNTPEAAHAKSQGTSPST